MKCPLSSRQYKKQNIQLCIPTLLLAGWEFLMLHRHNEIP